MEGRADRYGWTISCTGRSSRPWSLANLGSVYQDATCTSSKRIGHGGKDRLPKFPKDYRKRCNALVAGRIPSFQKTVRDWLITRYCPKDLRPSIRSSEPDEDCLIRLYLGRIRWRRGGSKIAPFSLRNDPLHLDQIESLELDFNLYAMILAEALADLYWRAHVDAKDVEFVLASPWEGDTIHDEGAVGRPARIHSVYLGEHAVWILDIDCCRDMQMDVQGVQQAMEAFYQNDPYFPRPGGRTSMEQTLWTIFRDHFLQTSEDIIGRGSPEADLPALWVDLVEIEGSYRAKLRRHL